VQIHSAVVAAVTIGLRASMRGGELLQCPSDELGSFPRRSFGQDGADRIIGGGHTIAEPDQGADCILRPLGTGKPDIDYDIAEAVLQLQDQPLGLFAANTAD
jgi:hypothetical protein